MAASLRWTVADLEVLPEEEGTRYEIIDGELYVTRQPSTQHQIVSGEAFAALHDWSRQSRMGVSILAPGVIFAADEAAAPDLVWISHQRLAHALDADGKLHAAPELAVEVLSPGSTNERRDREAKLKLYSRRGVDEYWILDWPRRQVEVYRREHAALRLVATLRPRDVLETPLLPGFSVTVERFFAGLP